MRGLSGVSAVKVRPREEERIARSLLPPTRPLPSKFQHITRQGWLFWDKCEGVVD